MRALVKLEQVLPSHLRRRVRTLQHATTTLPFEGGPRVDPQYLTVIAAACRDHERIRFAYRARDETQSRREVEPHSLVSAGRRWYLVAWDCDRSAWRTFRVDRLARPVSAGRRFSPHRLPAKDAAAFVAKSLASVTFRFEARLTVYAPAGAIERRRWIGGSVTPIDEDRCELHTGDDDLDRLAVRVLLMGYDFELHQPPELVARLREFGDRIGRAVGAEQ